MLETIQVLFFPMYLYKIRKKKQNSNQNPDLLIILILIFCLDQFLTLSLPLKANSLIYIEYVIRGSVNHTLNSNSLKHKCVDILTYEFFQVVYSRIKSD